MPKKSFRARSARNVAFKWPKIGSGQNTVSRVLFRKRELTEFCGKLGEFCDKLGEFALAHKQKKAERISLGSLPGTRSKPKNSLSSLCETVLSETVLSPFPIQYPLIREILAFKGYITYFGRFWC